MAAEGASGSTDAPEPEEGASTSETSGSEFLPGYPTLEDYSKALFSEVVSATKSSNALPKEGDEYTYYSSFPGFKAFCAKMGSRINRSIGKLMRYADLPCYWPPAPTTSTSTGGEGGVAGPEAVEEQFEALVEANDILLERVGILLDEAAGIKKSEKPVLPQAVQEGTAEVASWNQKRDSVREAVGSFRYIHGKSVLRPQLKFRDLIDNGSTSPFIPNIHHKPNARCPLPEIFKKLQNPVSLSATIANAKEWSQCGDSYAHPYKYELENLEYSDDIELREPTSPGSQEDTPLINVTTKEQLEEMKKELMSVTEFAVDMEHHSYRSYQGFVCLMQVSTRSKDYLVDTLEVREHMHSLLEPFTDPKIVKVMHGADWDVQWLQRDFSLYVVGLFDTGQASRVLQLPKFSLAFLLQFCCGVQADKQYQLADWRIRPLPSEMVKYAREDTHYLLYIYDRMRNELLRRGNRQGNLLRFVLDRSRDVCLKCYKKPQFSEDGFLKLFYKHKKEFNGQQLKCLQLLYKWRDSVAREQDESPSYVLPNHMLFQISEQLPREPQGMLACCNPIPTLLRQLLNDAFSLVQQAREEGGEGMAELSAVKTPHPPPTPPVPSPAPLHTPAAKALPPAPVTIRVTGPPVPTGKPVVTALALNKDPLSSLDAATRKKLQAIRTGFPNLLSEFIEATPMEPSDVILWSSRRNTETPGTTSFTPLSDTKETPLALHEHRQSNNAVASGSGIRSSSAPQKPRVRAKALSIKEMGKEPSEPKRRGKKRPWNGGEGGGNDRSVGEDPDGGLATREGRAGEPEQRKDFNPFDYEKAKFDDFVQGPESQSEPFEGYPQRGDGTRGGRGKGQGRKGHQGTKFQGPRSHTFGNHFKKHQSSSWPH